MYPRQKMINQPGPKFLRNSMEISDIHTKNKKYKIQPKNGPLFIDDIEGARAKPERHKKKDYNYMEYRDITDTKNIIRLQ